MQVQTALPSQLPQLLSCFQPRIGDLQELGALGGRLHVRLGQRCQTYRNSVNGTDIRLENTLGIADMQHYANMTPMTFYAFILFGFSGK